jgi:hypothetical protein
LSRIAACDLSCSALAAQTCQPECAEFAAAGAVSEKPSCEQGDESMPLLHLVEVLIVVGVILWLVNRFIPMQGSIKSILNGVVVIAVVLWLLNVFGLFHSLARMRVGL